MQSATTATFAARVGLAQPHLITAESKCLIIPTGLLKRDTIIIAAVGTYLLDSLGVFGRSFSGRDFPEKLPARIPLLHWPTVFHPPGKQTPVRRDKHFKL